MEEVEQEYAGITLCNEFFVIRITLHMTAELVFVLAKLEHLEVIELGTAHLFA